MKKELLRVNDLHIAFPVSSGGIVPVVHGISFGIKEGETLGIVGESGCGKSVTSLAVMGLLEVPPAGGEILFAGENLLKKSEKQMCSIRGKEISMIFQEPMTSLNPVVTVGKQIDEALLLHMPLSPKEARARSIEMLAQVKIPRAEKVYSCYPFELSGGMRQRVMIAMAMACKPRLLIADEPTTALDVTIQAQILHLMRELKRTTNTAIMFITHDLGVVASMCDRVLVMYSGELVEQAEVREIFGSPKHPYTKGLMTSIPRLGTRKHRLPSIPGQVPLPGTITQGCKFAPRCPEKMDICTRENPPSLELAQGHYGRCWLYAQKGEAAV